MSRKVTIAQIADAALKKLKLDGRARVVMTGRKTWVYAAAKKGQLVIAGEREGAKLYQFGACQCENACGDGAGS